MISLPRKSGLRRRLCAVATLVLLLMVSALQIADVLQQPLRLVLLLVLVAVVPAALWYAITRAGSKGRAAAAVALMALTGAIVLISTSGWQLLLRASLIVVAFLLGAYALGEDTRTLKSKTKTGVKVGPAKRPVLILNARSGGGKAEHFHLEEECRRRGVKPITIKTGDDIRALAQREIDAGADAIGVAGGDGSLAPVAGVAAANNVPFVVVPAGTFNHFALDLGLDRNHVLAALDAFGDAVERRVDLGEVNGRLFVNNVSVGLYASIIRRPEYRNAKVDTTLKELPKLLGEGSHPFDFHFLGPDGARCDAAHLVLVSNGPYGKQVLGLDTRPRLDTGELGIVSVTLPDPASERRLLDALASGRLERYEGFQTWSAPVFELTSGASIAAGLDGESVDLDPPLRFASRRAALRVRLPKHAIGLSPAARAEGLVHAIPDLWNIAVGRRRVDDDTSVRSVRSSTRIP